MCRFRLLFFLLLLSVSVHAADHYHLVRVLVQGSNRYSEADLVRATGLAADSQVDVNDLQNAAKRLGDSGVFSAVQFLYKPAIGANGIEADFKVTDSTQLLPAQFDNFVWFSNEELQAALHSALPLYAGLLPTIGQMPDDVVAVLTKLLSARSLPNQVSYILQSDIGKPPKSYLFRVDNAGLKVRSFNFVNVSRLDPGLLERPLQPLLGKDYFCSEVENFLNLNLLPVYLHFGFLKAEVSRMQPQLGENGAITLDISLTEGEQYKLAGFAWSGNTLIGSDELSKHVSLKTSEPVDGLKLQADLADVRKLFGKFGREAVLINPVPTFTGNAVSYKFDVREGELYHMGKLEVVAPDRQRQRILEAWKLPEGAPYDSTYIAQVTHQLAVETGEKRVEWRAHEHIDDANKIVNVRLDIKLAN